MPRLPRPSLPVLAGLAVLAITLAAYAGTLSAEFVAWDDGITIYNNEKLGDLSLERLAWAFTDTSTTMRWMPLSLLSLSLTHTLHGLDPFGYHLHNCLLHGAAALLLFLLLRELLGRAARRGGGDGDGPWVLASAAVGALAWSLHPLRAEVVAWSNSRGHAQATLFVFLSLFAYLRTHAGDPPARRPWLGTGLSAAAFLAALMSHPIAIGATPVFLLLDVHLGRLGGRAGWWTPAARRVLLEKLPFAAAAAGVLVVSLLIRTYLWGRWKPPVTLDQWGLFPRAMQATWIWIHYVLVTLWPAGLQPAPTELIHFDPWTAPFLLRALAVVALSAALLLLRRRWPTALLLWLAHLSLLVPALGLTEHPMFANDRYANLPGLVPATIAGAVMLRLGSTAARRRVAGAVAAALLAVLGGRSVAQARIWTNSVTLFEHMLPLIGDDPYRVNIFAFLGFAQLERGNAPAAVAALQQAVVLQPLDPTLRVALSEALFRADRAADAVPHLEQALRFHQGDADLRCQLGAALFEAGRVEEALAAAQAALQLAPASVCAQRLLLQLRAAGRR